VKLKILIIVSIEHVRCVDTLLSVYFRLKNNIPGAVCLIKENWPV